MSARLNRRSASVLQRGAACLACRKRKLKCDSTKPVCQPCSRMNRTTECIYDEKPKSRNQLLREKLSVLEEHVRALESYEARHPSDLTPSSSSSSSSSSSWRNVTMHSPTGPNIPDDDYIPGISIIFPSKSRWLRRTQQATDAIDSIKVIKSPPDSPDLPYAWHSPENSPICIQDPPAYPLAPSPFSVWHILHDLPESVLQETSDFLLERFVEYREHCWFYSDVQRLRRSLHSHGATDDCPHPALLNAVYLLACHFARSTFCSKLEPLFLARTLHQVAIALDRSDRLVDIVQASCLLAIYFYLNCQISEGYRQAFTAVRLATALGLHQIDITRLGLSAQLWGDPREEQQQGQKIHAFWQTYMVDRYWSTVYNLQTALPEFYTVCERITTPLPETAETLDSILTLKERHSHVLVRQQSDFSQSASLSTSTLKILAAGLYEKTHRLCNMIPEEEDNAYWAECQTAEFDVQWFYTVLPKYSRQEIWAVSSSIFGVDLFTLWTLIHVSNMHLQQALKLTDGALQSGFNVIAMLRQLELDDYPILDPIICACWYHVAKVFAITLAEARTSLVMASEMERPLHDVERGILSINSALHEFAKYSRLSGRLAAKCDMIKNMGGM
ncbi:hypothetical protein AX15_004968 [Amanita polypyramis BW_CC]|nr:hypothetical protein AX15_004968 [Amanita polypyramis BW_CC]